MPKREKKDHYSEHDREYWKGGTTDHRVRSRKAVLAALTKHGEMTEIAVSEVAGLSLRSTQLTLDAMRNESAVRKRKHAGIIFWRLA